MVRCFPSVSITSTYNKMNIPFPTGPYKNPKFFL